MRTVSAVRSSSLLAILLAALAAPAGAARAAPSPAEVEPAVRDAIAADGKATFWVYLREQADLTPAPAIRDWAARGALVVERLQETARRSQVGLLGLLEKRGVEHRAFWIVNVVRVTGGVAILDEVAVRPEVAEVRADRTYELPPVRYGEEHAALDGIEWNILRVRAPEVWADFGGTGEGIVVANIDSGVQAGHPALRDHYRGNLGGVAVDHNYNWFDPSQICGTPSLAPCDNNGHGTHTMGTMVGDDGGANQIGVAPGAKFIAAKGCESFSCSNTALLASAQWVLAPTDLAGQNPRADLRPHVVNNSWGGGGGDPWYQGSVNAWIAAGIFPAFSNGNSGPSCGSSGSPGDYPQTYSAGAFDINNNIASFSSRGGSSFGVIKPNIAAPGVGVRSSYTGSTYRSLDGTSMASPHVAGTVALMWSVAPVLLGDVISTAQILDLSAVDTADASCGGTPADNNVWGEGRLDAYRAVDFSPRGPTGVLEGTVMDLATGFPLAGAAVHATGPSSRAAQSDPSGFYRFAPALPVGIYEVTAGLFGYLTETISDVPVNEGVTTVQDFHLSPAPSHGISGFVRSPGGDPVDGAAVVILGTPIPPTDTDATGFYSFASVPEGIYDVQAIAPGRCVAPLVQPLEVIGDETLDFDLDRRRDGFGHTCEEVPAVPVLADWVSPLTGDDASRTVTLPFPFPFYGDTYTQAHVSTNGHINFLSPSTAYSNGPIPSGGAPNAAIYVLWDDLVVDSAASVRGRVVGSAPNRVLIVQWTTVHFYNETGRRVSFQALLGEDGRIQFQYGGIDAVDRERGASATIGIENAAGTDGLQYSFNEAVLEDGRAILFQPPSP